MSIPKTKKLQAEEAARESSVSPTLATAMTSAANTGPIKIREVKCCNDFIAIMQFQVETNIALVNTEDAFKNEGIVVGVGPGVADGAGGRLKPCVEVGETVMFGARNIAAVIESSTEPYKGKKIVIVSEKSIMCKLHRQVPFEFC